MKGRILVAVQFGCLLALALLPSSTPMDTLRRWAAIGLGAIAVVVVTVAARNLRSALTVFPEPRADAPFITHGIYGWLRHPMYTSVLALGLAFVCWHWNLWAVGVWLALFIDLSIKYRYEDRLLLAKWPTARAYQQQVGALLPRFRS